MKIRDFRKKIDLLLNAKKLENGQLTPKFPRGKAQIAETIGIDPTELSKEDQLPAAHAGKFLGLFFEVDGKKDDRIPDSLDPNCEGHRPWLDLLAQPVTLFRALVRLNDGDDFAGEAGSIWDEFIQDRRARQCLAPPAKTSFKIVAKSLDEWRHPVSSGAGATGHRMLPPGVADPLKNVPRGIPVVKAGHRAKIVLDIADAWPNDNVLWDGAYIFMAQDILISRRRYAIPLVPAPAGSQASMPGHRWQPAREGADSSELVVPIPAPAGAEGSEAELAQYLEIPSGWGSRRLLYAIVSEFPLPDAVIAASTRENPMAIEYLDLIAATLQEAKGKYVVWELDYAVDEGNGNG